jgi:hypothetical protein
MTCPFTGKKCTKDDCEIFMQHKEGNKNTGVCALVKIAKGIDLIKK